MRQRGFTLTELLIVIAVIMILMGLLFPIFSMVREQARRAKCLALIMQVVGACDIYKNLNQAYPDSAGPATPNLQTIFQPGGPGTTPVAWSPTLDWNTVAAELLVQLQTVDRDHFQNMTLLVDPWKNVLHYRPNQYYPYITTGTPVPIDSASPPNPDGFQLWSCATNGKDEAGQKGATVGLTTAVVGDDINNWKQ